MAAESLPCYCIKEPRCRLCQFPLENGELAVAGTGEDHISAAFSFVRYDTFEDDEEDIAIHMCCDCSCTKGDFRVHGFHHDCYSFRLFPITSRFLTATEYQFSPPVGEGVRRWRRIQHKLAAKLRLGFLRGLPEEICRMVAGFLVRECAVVNFQELTSAVAASVSPLCRYQKVHLSRDVYAQYIDIEGVRYIQALSNVPPSTKAQGRVRVLKAQHGRVVQKIYIRYDHLGIRGVWFTLPNNGLLRSLDTSGVWWTELSRKDKILQVTTNSDGLKIRHILDSTSKRGRPVPVLGWPKPGLACTVMDLETCKAAREFNHLRMNFIDCNAPGIEGYSAAICGSHVSKLYAHHSGTDMTCYEELGRMANDILWLYMPIDQDECLEELWAIRREGAGCVALILLTNERAVMFGPYLPHPEFHRISTTSKHPSRIYFNEWDPEYDDTWIKFLGVDTNDVDTLVYQNGKDHRSQYPYSLVPAAPPPYTQYNELWYYTNCRMENVTEITPCVNGTTEDKPVIGILLRYKDGRRSCLGQYRLDWALAPIRTDPASALTIGMGKTVKGFPYVARICLQGMACLTSLRWINISWRGRLEWWFSPRQCELRFYEQGEEC